MRPLTRAVTAAVVLGSLMSACSAPAPAPGPPSPTTGTPATGTPTTGSPPDHSTIAGTVNGYLAMLKATPSPTADQVNAWVAPAEQERVRTWFRQHPSVRVTVDSYQLLGTHSDGAQAAIAATGQACPDPGTCVPLATAAAKGAIKLVKTDTKPVGYLLSSDSALRLLGRKSS